MMDQRSDHDLIQSARSHDPAAIDELLARNLDRLRAFVRLRVPARLRAKESASDLVQSVCKDLLGNLDEFDYRGEAAFRGWLFTAALNKIREHERHFGRAKRDADREVQLEDGDAERLAACYAAGFSPSRIAMANERAAVIEAAFDRLPDDYREVLTLSRYAALPHAEIARRMDRSEGAVRVLLSRALTRLSSLLIELDPDADATPSST